MDLNTKQDYLNILPLYPEATKKKLQMLLDSRFIWVNIAVLADNASGIENDTHRVIGEGERIQQQLVEDENAEIFRKGFTVDEVEELIANA